MSGIFFFSYFDFFTVNSIITNYVTVTFIPVTLRLEMMEGSTQFITDNYKV